MMEATNPSLNLAFEQDFLGFCTIGAFAAVYTCSIHMVECLRRFVWCGDYRLFSRPPEEALMKKDKPSKVLQLPPWGGLV